MKTTITIFVGFIALLSGYVVSHETRPAAAAKPTPMVIVTTTPTPTATPTASPCVFDNKTGKPLNHCTY